MVELDIIKKYVSRQLFVQKLFSLNLDSRYQVLDVAWERGRILFAGKDKEWRGGFHGTGFYCKNKISGEEIDFDFGEKGEVGGFSSWFLFLFVKKRIEQGELDREIYGKYASAANWEKYLDELERNNIIKKESEGKLYFLNESLKSNKGVSDD